MSENSKIIRDPIHGDIRFDDVFIDIIESPEIQRLYNIKQLGLAHLVFPGAHHTRLEHSLGTFYLASKASSILDLNDDDKIIVECAALLHDIGHGPFSHTLESILRESINVDHVDLTEKLIFGIHNVYLENEEKYLTSPSVFDILNKNQIDHKRIVDLINGKNNSEYFLNQLLNSAIDVDQLDYLVRDAYYTGVAYGLIDVERFLRTLVIKNNGLMVKKKGVNVIENILMARALMYSTVYFHKTVRISELMLSKAIELIADLEPFYFFKMIDGELLSELKRQGAYQEEIVTRLKYRKLFKQAFTRSKNDLTKDEMSVVKKLEKTDFRREKEKEIIDSLGLSDGSLIIDIPYQELRKAEPRIDQSDIKILDEDDIKTLNNFTPIANALKNRAVPDWMIMIVTDGKYRDLVHEKAEKILFN